MLIFSGAISAFNAVGVMVAPTGTNNFNMDQQQWYEITSGTGEGVTTTWGDQATTDQYSNAGSKALSDFIIGTVYVKGVIDPYFGNNPVEQIFSSFAQGIAYFCAIIGSLSWILNKYSGV